MKNRIPLDYEIATAIAQDAGNFSMREANRKSWNGVDWKVAYRQFKKLQPLINWEDHETHEKIRRIN